MNVYIPELSWVWDHGPPLVFRTFINNSIINVECDVTMYDDIHFSLIYTRAYDLAKTAANLVCFKSGDAVTAVFETMILPSGMPSTLRFHDPSLDGLAKSVSETGGSVKFNDLVNLVFREQGVYAALNDLIECNATPHISAVNCGRVLDSLRMLITPDKDPKIGWEMLRNTLHVSRSFLQMITDTATPARHGDRSHITGDITMECIRRTWIIMDRYFEYRLRGNILEKSDFALLT